MIRSNSPLLGRGSREARAIERMLVDGQRVWGGPNAGVRGAKDAWEALFRHDTARGASSVSELEYGWHNVRRQTGRGCG